MNYRDEKKFIPGNYYHVYNRGNGKMDVFKDNQDYFNFIKRIKLTLGQNDGLEKIQHQVRIYPLPENSFSIICYCLMPNHFHLLIRQNSYTPISMLINKVCSSYAKYFNKKYEHVGHLFQDQFKAVQVEGNDYLLWLSAYIHQNPNIAGISGLANYKWSSYWGYTNNHIESEREKLICDNEIILSQFKNHSDYIKYVDDSYEIIKNNKFFDKVDIALD